MQLEQLKKNSRYPNYPLLAATQVSSLGIVCKRGYRPSYINGILVVDTRAQLSKYITLKIQRWNLFLSCIHHY